MLKDLCSGITKLGRPSEEKIIKFLEILPGNVSKRLACREKDKNPLKS